MFNVLIMLENMQRYTRIWESVLIGGSYIGDYLSYLIKYANYPN